MTRRIAYMRADGGLTISEIMPKERLLAVWGARNPGTGAVELSDEEYERRTQDKLAERMARTGATDAVELPDDWSPPDIDRAFRDAWILAGAVLSVDMDKARSIHRDRLRQSRASLLADLDVQYLRADEAGDAAGKADIAARKQVLREVTDGPAIDAAATLAELRAAWPADLGRGPYDRRGEDQAAVPEAAEGVAT